ncbi:hypothetical protein [Maribacter stanieri]|uniref:hypothetical protein n=1 Tax=Maribacter stanieri TaxID=440514 RepID=UPI00249505AD|nr:hypothetical protein [Maribacter stanieri]
MKRLFAIILSFLFCGCTGVKFYSDEGLSKETGIKFYQAIPYLLVEKNTKKDETLKTSIIYLPDMSKPTYAKLYRGMGSFDFKTAFENGSISSFGSVTDTKIPETITSLAGALTSYGGAAKALAEASGIKDSIENQDGLEEQSGSGENVTKKADEAILYLEGVKATLKELKIENVNSQNLAKEISNGLDTVIRLLLDYKLTDWPNATTTIANLKSNLEELKVTDNKTLNGEIDKLKKDMDKASNALIKQKDKKVVPSWNLYKIDNTSGTTKLIKVNLD